MGSIPSGDAYWLVMCVWGGWQVIASGGKNFRTVPVMYSVLTAVSLFKSDGVYLFM